MDRLSVVQTFVQMIVKYASFACIMLWIVIHIYQVSVQLQVQVMNHPNYLQVLHQWIQPFSPLGILRHIHQVIQQLFHQHYHLKSRQRLHQ